MRPTPTKGNQMILPLTPVSSEKFRYSAKSNTFTARLSELEDFELQRIYSNSYDFGFSMQSSKTGNTVIFGQLDEVHHDDGRLWCWTFFCITPGFKHLKAIIFND